MGAFTPSVSTTDSGGSTDTRDDVSCPVYAGDARFIRESHPRILRARSRNATGAKLASLEFRFADVAVLLAPSRESGQSILNNKLSNRLRQDIPCSSLRRARRPDVGSTLKEDLLRRYRRRRFEVVSLTGRKSISYHLKAAEYGAVAQLAERVARIHEARGSNPLSSITPT